jgi:hypothetical protein
MSYQSERDSQDESRKGEQMHCCVSLDQHTPYGNTKRTAEAAMHAIEP